MKHRQAGKVHRIGKLQHTRMCSFFLANKCKYNDQWTFAHSTDDLLEKPNLVKTKNCYKWQRGRCGLSAAECRFAHGALDTNGIALVDSERPRFGKVTSLGSTTTVSTSASEGMLDHEEELLAKSGEEQLDRSTSMSTFAIEAGHHAWSPNGSNAKTLEIDTAHAISPLAQSSMFKKQTLMETCLTIFFARTASMSPGEITKLAALLMMTPHCPNVAKKVEQLLQEATPERYED